MLKEFRSANKEKEENEPAEDGKAAYSSNALEKSEINTMNNNSHMELDKCIGEVEAENSNNSESDIDAEVEF